MDNKKETERGTWIGEDGEELWDADLNCEHKIINLWSGVRCEKCGGWCCY